MGDELEKPPTYMDKWGSDEKDKYVFISYSHRDADYVYRDLAELNRLGLNFWYDKDLISGEEWNVSAIERIKNPNCCGVLFYFSENMICSKAVKKEVEAFFEVKSYNSEFKMKMISIGGRTVLQLLRDYFLKQSDSSASQLENTFSQEDLAYMIDKFNSAVLFLSKSTPTDYSHLKRLVEELQEYDLNLVGSDDNQINKLINSGRLQSVDGRYTMTYGSYPMNRVQNEPSYKNGFFEKGRNRYYSENMKVFSVQPIQWNLLKMEKGVGTFVSSNCIDAVLGKDLDLFLKATFPKKAFDEKEKNVLIGDVSLINKGDLVQNANIIPSANMTDYSMEKLCGRGGIVFLWLSDDVPDSKKKICSNLSNVILSNGRPLTGIAGVRPVIRVKFNE